jgi:Helix-turn-helix.
MALRSAREAKQLTQGQVADAMDWSLSKVMRIEKGDVNISPADLRVLLNHLGIDEPAEVKRLMDDARISRKARWTADPLERMHLPDALIQLMEFEQEATVIRHYASVIVPGLLQTPSYAEAVLTNFDLDEQTVAARKNARLRRREQVLGRPDSPKDLLILDESVLLRQVGGPTVMAEQLEFIVSLMEEKSSVEVRVVPFAGESAIALLGPFTLVDLGGDNNAVLYRESLLKDEIVDTPSDIRRHRELFERLWKRALKGKPCIDLIKSQAARMNADADDAGMNKPRPARTRTSQDL